MDNNSSRIFTIASALEEGLRDLLVRMEAACRSCGGRMVMLVMVAATVARGRVLVMMRLMLGMVILTACVAKRVLRLVAETGQ